MDNNRRKRYNNNEIKTVMQHLIDTKGTIQSTAEYFDLYNTTVYRMIERLSKIDVDLYNNVTNLMNTNKNQRYSRGGFAKRDKYYRQWEDNNTRI